MAAECEVSVTVLSNAENGLNYPSRDIMGAYWRGYGIDFNFLIAGSFKDLSYDLQGRIFDALEAATSEWDQRENSGRSRPSKQPSPRQTRPSQA